LGEVLAAGEVAPIEGRDHTALFSPDLAQSLDQAIDVLDPSRALY